MLKRKWLLTCLLAVFAATSVTAQTEYASTTTFSENASCAACSVTNPQHAVDGNLNNFSTVEATDGATGGFIEQTLIFNNAGLIGDSLVIGLKFDSLIDVNNVDNVFFETFTGAQTNNDRRSINDPAILIANQTAGNRIDFYFLTSYPYDRVSVRIEAGGTADTVQIYYANKTQAKDLPSGPCVKPIAQSTEINNFCSSCDIENAENSADSDESSFSTFKTTTDLFAAGFVEQNLQFGNAGFHGDTIRFFVEDPSGNLAANNFDNIEIRTSLGSEENNDSKTVGHIDVPFVNQGGNRWVFKYVARFTFDIATIRMNVRGGLGNEDSLRLYYACRVSKDDPVDTVFCQQSMFESNGADASCTNCEVQNANDAVDGNDTTASTLVIDGLFATGVVFQEFELPFIGGDQDRYTLRISNPNGNIDASNLGNLTVQTFIGQNPNNDERVVKEDDLDVIGGPRNWYEYTYEAYQPFDRIRVELEAGDNSQLQELNIFFVCVRDYDVDSTVFIPCEAADSTSEEATALCTSCDVIDPLEVLDSDDDTYSVLKTSDNPPFQINFGSVEQTIVFNSPACGKDSVKFVIGSDDLSVDTSRFDGLTITFINNVETTRDTVASYTVSGDDLTLINGTSKFRMAFSPGSAYDAVIMNNEINTVEGHHRDIRWYSACKTALYPAIPLFTETQICYGDSAVLFANTPQDSVVPSWWDAPTGGTMVGQGFSFTTPNLTDTTTYYVEALDTTTGCTSDVRRAVTVGVYNQTAPAVLDVDSVSLCFGELVTITPKPFGDNFNFYLNANGTEKIYTGTELTIFPVISDSVIYVQHISPFGGCEDPALVPFNIYLKPITPNAELVEDSVTVCRGTFTDLVITQDDTVEAQYFWYTDQFGGNEVFNGDSLRLENILQDTVFYVERVSAPCGPALERTEVHVFAIDEPVATFANDSVFVCEDSIATVTATSTVSEAEFYWYDAPTGGNLFYTGSTFSFAAPADTSVVVYIAAKLDECEQVDRTPLTVFQVDTLLDLMVYDTTICSGEDVIIGVRTRENGAMVNWYDAPTGGNLLGSGDSLQITNALDTTVYYAEVNYSSNCPIDRVPVQVNVIPPIMLNAVMDTVYYCSNEQPTFTVEKNFQQIQVSWYNSETGTGLIGTGDSFTFSPVGDTTTVWYDGDFLDCEAATRKPAVAIFADQLAIPQVSDTLICEGLPITLLADVDVPDSLLVWYDAQSGGNILATGPTFTTNALFNDTTYYVGVDLGTYCNNLPRVPLSVFITNQLAAPSNLVCNEDAATLTSVRFDWTPNPEAVAYEVSLDNGASWIASNTGASHIVNGLSPEECVDLMVRSVGDVACETSTSIGPMTCCALPCDTILAFLIPEYEVCTGDQVTITVYGDPLDEYEYSFNGGANFNTVKSFTYTPGSTETFEVVVRFRDAVAKQECDPVTLSTEVIVHGRPTVDFTMAPVDPIVEGEIINDFQVTYMGSTSSNDNFHYEFYDNNGNLIGQAYQKDPIVALPIAPLDQDYTVTACLNVIDENGCNTRRCKQDIIRVFTVRPVHVPNGFTPDEPTNNTVRIIHEEGFVDLERFAIYNNYGNVVFESNSINKEWDGTFQGEPQPAGVYVYTLQLRDDLGRLQTYQGTITLIR